MKGRIMIKFNITVLLIVLDFQIRLELYHPVYFCRGLYLKYLIYLLTKQFTP